MESWVVGRAEEPLGADMESGALGRVEGAPGAEVGSWVMSRVRVLEGLGKGQSELVVPHGLYSFIQPL